jgi:hypothetical protein
MMIWGILFAVKSIFPAINQFKSAKPISKEIISLMKPGDELIIYKEKPSPFNFYTGIYPIKEVDTQEDLLRLFQSGKRIFCLILERDFERMRESLVGVYPLKEANIGHRKFILVTNSKVPLM